MRQLRTDRGAFRGEGGRQRRVGPPWLARLVLLAILAAGCGAPPPPEAPSASPGRGGTPAAGGTPLPKTLAAGASPTLSTAPGLLPAAGGPRRQFREKVTVRMDTSLGEVQLEVYPEAAPLASQRFLRLCRDGYYDGVPVSRVVEGTIAQWGINWRPAYRSWQRKKLLNDPPRYALERGTLAFTKSGEERAPTQVFVNLRDNPQLRGRELGYTAFGRVVQGMSVVDRFPVVGDPNQGLDQARLWADGASYLAGLQEADRPAMITRVQVESRSSVDRDAR